MQTSGFGFLRVFLTVKDKGKLSYHQYGTFTQSGKYIPVREMRLIRKIFFEDVS